MNRSRFGLILEIFLSLIVAETYGFNLADNGQVDVKANWPLVQDLIWEFNGLIAQVATQIIVDADQDNPEVAIFIYAKLGEYYPTILDLAFIVQEEINRKNLTVPVAKQHLGEIYTIIVDIHIAIMPEFPKLQPSTVEKINEHFSFMFLRIPQIAEEVYEALEEPDAPSCGLTAHRPNEVITPDDPTHTDTLPGTVIWYGNVFGVSETFVQLHPHNKYLDSEETHQSPAQFLVKTTRDFGNFIDEMNVTSIHRTVMFLCTDGTSVTNTFEIPVITGPIVEPTVKPILK